MSNRTLFVAAVLGTLWLLPLLPGLGQAGAQEPRLVVVVHESRGETSFTEADVSRMFLGKTTRWEDGEKVRPVDHAERTAQRAAFLQTYHEMDEAGYAKYWIKRVFAGRGKPPETVQDDAGVLRLVSADRNAIGYVSSDTELIDDVVPLREASP